MEKKAFYHQNEFYDDEHRHDVDALESAELNPSPFRRDRLAVRVLHRFIIAITVGFICFTALSWLPLSIPNFRLPCHRISKESVDDGLRFPSFMGDDAVPLRTFKAPAGSKRIPLEAHIMSRCPDARDCLRQLVVPAMEQISDKVDFELSFIASVSNKSTEVICKHGPTECIGNMLVLCAANLPFPSRGHSMSRTPTIRSLGFANCLVSSYERIPERSFVEQCALEHGIDFDALNECASQQDDDPGHDGFDKDPLSGIALLRKSALYSESLGIKTSCTVRLDEQVWCVRDDGVWKDCAKGGEGSQVSVFVEEIKKLWKQQN
ncbi:GILT family protein [Aspergillus clavatus NRRL 1]|uniref:Gamma interferon inducible lysosomal thiol reductase (GILT), putative n=1 Tax=Aspergillus clavatus (strain ATCC 1007 / CBS 513.65 / DSM 816 / NCTC 3887 / NRRL 1 / QM 1276 / 107) TaxID=344612 RepID=A1C7Q8_ASPCL|nr:gamma interferon inducible lysosomal thiol reductase (GILT), putative [Aspergillus clavatus NRRL 1]EAW14429.1 gamma interferon inducible lysosomal thiol reductase (GILT), putative [Aspergillus clavatus NRRL 1]